MLQKMNHLVLFCKNTDETKKWYDLLGFTYLRGYDHMYWYQLGEMEIMLHPSTESSGVNSPHFYIGVSDVDSFFKVVVEKGLRPYDHEKPSEIMSEPITRPWGHREFQLDDPEGHCWSIVQI